MREDGEQPREEAKEKREQISHTDPEKKVKMDIDRESGNNVKSEDTQDHQSDGKTG